ncbi:uncharacterized protein LOC128619445 [Ictalurus furcatus]|uniref:uncharacterized protein LOC128619445 n=1 Tax=Ictalurus furcatus TaxID=66913 RepID=UPI0023505B27|nr:uncharacterized protein LOC128619445 [Ictalurus furcatus]
MNEPARPFTTYYKTTFSPKLQLETHKVVSTPESQSEMNMATFSPELQHETHEVVSTPELQHKVTFTSKVEEMASRDMFPAEVNEATSRATFPSVVDEAPSRATFPSEVDEAASRATFLSEVDEATSHTTFTPEVDEAAKTAGGGRTVLQPAAGSESRSAHACMSQVRERSESARSDDCSSAKPSRAAFYGADPTLTSHSSAGWEQEGNGISTYEQLTSRFRTVFDHSPDNRETGEDLLSLVQGSRCVADYALEFRTVAARSGWNQPALKAMFRRGLNADIVTELACRDDQLTFDSLINVAIRLDRLLRSRRSLRSEAEAPASGSPKALIDSGVAGNFIDQETILQYNIPVRPLSTPRHVQAIDGAPIGDGLITHYPVVLGLPWLEHHNPQISWNQREITRWSAHCINHCLQVPVISLASTSIESPDKADNVLIPSVYHDLIEVFSKKKASGLPPHRDYDCAIDLLPGTTPPRGRVYPLTVTEQKAMEEYIQEALHQGYIRPSTSPASAGFFFVEKKGGGLRPCIDYRGLNQCCVKYRYPLPLVPAALEQLRTATIFTKLDLRSAYNLVRIREGDEWKTGFSTTSGHYEYQVMPYGLSNAPSVFQCLINDVLRDMLGHHVIAYIDDILIYSDSREEHVHHVRQVLQRLLRHQLYVKAEKCEFHRTTIAFLGYVISPEGISMDQEKVQAVVSWPTPTTIKELQRFLGFANFYRRFIRNFSAIANPLTSLLKGKPKRLSWNSSAQSAFDKLKKAFTTAPIIKHPDPSRPFIVEVDASETGVGAILSQRFGEKPKLHLVAFFSRKLSPAERNYDVGNRELLAIKLALEEWRHWLEGATHQFVIFTDHKNLEYLRTAKRLTPRQARWALFFTRFHFTLSYRPGSKNTKADALSRLDHTERVNKHEEYIIHPSCVINALEWDLDQELEQIPQSQVPVKCPPNKLFVPEDYRQELIIWAHTCVLGYQPPLFPWNATPTAAPAVDHWFERSERVWADTHRRLKETTDMYKHKADRRCKEHPNYQPGDRVWLSTKDLRQAHSCKKLTPRYTGLFKILKRVNEVTYRLELLRHSRISPSFHVSHLKPVVNGPLATQVPAETSPTPLEIDGQPAYRVKDILKSRHRRGKLEYLNFHLSVTNDNTTVKVTETTFVPHSDV